LEFSWCFCSIIWTIFFENSMMNFLFKDVECYGRGECSSFQLISYAKLDTPKECHQYCIEEGICDYFTHYIENNEDREGGCFTYLDCRTFLYDCLDCVSGSVDCPLLGEVSISFHLSFNNMCLKLFFCSVLLAR